MDLKMAAETITSNGVYWDCQVQDGIVPIISGDEEDLQCATIASFLIRGTVPLLPDAGVPWTDFLTHKMSFGELDYYIRESLLNVEKQTFYPDYSIGNQGLKMTIQKKEDNSEFSN